MLSSSYTVRIACAILLMFTFAPVCLHAQAPVFTHDDTLRGTITRERAWWDLLYYHLDINVDPAKQQLSGKVTVQYKVLEPYTVLQIDLQQPLVITQVLMGKKKLTFTRDGANAYKIKLPQVPARDAIQSLDVYYNGSPVVAKNPPWQGGIQWAKTTDGSPFIATSCQGLGASVWWPCKDHMYDEPDSMLMSITVPEDLMDVSNGRLRSVVENKKARTKTYHWFVGNPINNYGVNLNIAKYAHFADTLHGEAGTLDLNFYVLPENLEKAKVQFKQAKLMLKAFEYWFGPYPFYKDGYKLVEAPYLGMEHQSSVTYGNGYGNGYRGRDLSGTGYGLKWDFIIIHESGHEWYANNITYQDIADMWIHESFTNYSEGLYTEYYFGKEAATDYVVGTRRGIQNRMPVIGVYNVNKGGSGDMYPKGGNMIHTIRHSIGNDVLFRDILRGMNKTFYHQTVRTEQIEGYISKRAGRDYTNVFDQYLRSVKIPQFDYYYAGNKLFYRWSNVVPGFDLPLRLSDGAGAIILYPTAQWQSQEPIIDKPIDAKYLERMYYITVRDTAQ